MDRADEPCGRSMTPTSFGFCVDSRRAAQAGVQLEDHQVVRVWFKNTLSQSINGSCAYSALAGPLKTHFWCHETYLFPGVCAGSCGGRTVVP